MITKWTVRDMETISNIFENDMMTEPRTKKYSDIPQCFKEKKMVNKDGYKKQPTQWIDNQPPNTKLKSMGGAKWRAVEFSTNDSWTYRVSFGVTKINTTDSQKPYIETEPTRWWLRRKSQDPSGDNHGKILYNDITICLRGEEISGKVLKRFKKKQ